MYSTLTLLHDSLSGLISHLPRYFSYRFSNVPSEFKLNTTHFLTPTPFIVLFSIVTLRSPEDLSKTSPVSDTLLFKILIDFTGDAL